MARVTRIAGGFLLIIAGIFMLVLPGPGIVTIVAGLALMSRDVVWAGRLADWARQRFAKYMGRGPETSTSDPSLNGKKGDSA